jgi:hypothetical protein
VWFVSSAPVERTAPSDDDAMANQEREPALVCAVQGLGVQGNMMMVK